MKGEGEQDSESANHNQKKKKKTVDQGFHLGHTLLSIYCTTTISAIINSSSTKWCVFVCQGRSTSLSLLEM